MPDVRFSDHMEIGMVGPPRPVSPRWLRGELPMRARMVRRFRRLERAWQWYRRHPPQVQVQMQGYASGVEEITGLTITPPPAGPYPPADWAIWPRMGEGVWP